MIHPIVIRVCGSSSFIKNKLNENMFTKTYPITYIMSIKKQYQSIGLDYNLEMEKLLNETSNSD